MSSAIGGSGRFLLWFSAVVVAATFAAPRFTASLLAGRLRQFAAASRQTRLVVLLSPT